MSEKKLTTTNAANQIFVDQFTKLVNLIKAINIVESDKTSIQTNNFKILSFNKVIQSIIKFKVQITSSLQLIGIPGFGKGTIDRVQQILTKGYLQEVVELENKHSQLIRKNKIINELIDVIGIGEFIANKLIDKYKITSLQDLKIRAKLNTININDKIKLGLKYAGKFETKIPRKTITKIYDQIDLIAKKLNPNLITTVCGSYRREMPQSSDIDLLICDSNLMFKKDLKNSSTLKNFITELKKSKIITDDITSDEVVSKYMGFCKHAKKNYRIDIRFVPFESYFTALLYFTGSYQLNTIMRKCAKKLGFKLNEYGLFNISNNKQFKITSEKQIFDFLKINYLEPTQRNIL